MATVRDLIKGSLRLIGAIATGETPSADEQSDAVTVLNEMLDSWSIEGLIVHARVREEFTLIPGQQTYTMGPSGDFNTTRPIRLDGAGIVEQGSNTFELPIAILTLDEWAQITVKNTQSTIPTRLYAEGTHPLDTLNLWPVPSVAQTIALYSAKTLTRFANANAEVELPPGYAKALRYGLALELAAEYGKQPDPAIVIQATEAKENIKRVNIRPEYLECDAGTLTHGRVFNWLTGE